MECSDPVKHGVRIKSGTTPQREPSTHSAATSFFHVNNSVWNLPASSGRDSTCVRKSACLELAAWYTLMAPCGRGMITVSRPALLRQILGIRRVSRSLVFIIGAISQSDCVLHDSAAAAERNTTGRDRTRLECSRLLVVSDHLEWALSSQGLKQRPQRQSRTRWNGVICRAIQPVQKISKAEIPVV